MTKKKRAPIIKNVCFIEYFFSASDSGNKTKPKDFKGSIKWRLEISFLVLKKISPGKYQGSFYSLFATNC
jgi:hypothetical protein